MANENNLKPIQSTKEARELGRKGGIASGVSRREKRKMRDIICDLVEKPDPVTGENVKEAIALGLIAKAKGGDLKAYDKIVAVTDRDRFFDF